MVLLNAVGLLELSMLKGRAIESRMKYGPKLERKHGFRKWWEAQTGRGKLGYSSGLCDGPKIPRVRWRARRCVRGWREDERERGEGLSSPEFHSPFPQQQQQQQKSRREPTNTSSVPPDARWPAHLANNPLWSGAKDILRQRWSSTSQAMFMDNKEEFSFFPLTAIASVV